MDKTLVITYAEMNKHHLLYLNLMYGEVFWQVEEIIGSGQVTFYSLHYRTKGFDFNSDSFEMNQSKSKMYFTGIKLYHRNPIINRNEVESSTFYANFTQVKLRIWAI